MEALKGDAPATLAVADEQASAQPANHKRNPAGWIHVRWLLTATVAFLAGMAILYAPVDVPDTSSPVTSNIKGNVDAEASIGQVFVPTRDNLHQISVVMVTEQSSDILGITFTVRNAGPSGEILRTVEVPISDLPEGDLFPYNPEHPGIRDQAWHTFEFEPILDSAGRKLYFSIEGKDLPAQNRVRVALMFTGRYTQGKAYVNGGEQNAHVVFRAESRGRVKDYLGVLARNLTSGKQGPLANPGTYVALGVVYLLLLGGLLRAVGRVLRP